MSDQYPQHPQDPYRSGDPAQQGTYGQQPAPSAYRATPTTMSPQDERTWGAISHAGAVVAMICSAGFLGFLASLAVYVILGIVTLGVGFFVFLPVFLVPLVFAGILHVIGAVKAYNGDWWNPPMTPQFVS